MLSCKQSAKITITGILDSCEGTVVKITSIGFKTTYDSTRIKNKRFKFVIDLPEDGFYQLDFNSRTPHKGSSGWMHPCEFFAENGAIYQFKASGAEEILYNRYDMRSSSVDEKKFNEYKRLVNLKIDTIRAKRKYYLNKADEALNAGQNKLYNTYADSINLTEGAINQASLPAIHQFVSQNPNTIITPYLIAQTSDIYENYALYKKALNGLSAKVKQSKYYNEANKRLKSMKK